MSPERWRKIQDLYSAALQAGPEERGALIARGDPEVGLVVKEMLSQDSGSRIFDSPPNSPFETSADTVAIGSEFGPYRIQAFLGAGGMGTVYRAVDSRLGREVALKVASARYSERFRHEARAISTLNHPHVCTLYDVGPNYLVMELIEGSTLAAEIEKGPLAIASVARYGSQIASALAEAHARGIVHRDLKPGNIMVTRHGIKVLDFGLARTLAETRITETNAILGTPAYMSPEQVEGRDSTAAADLFALGLVLHEMTTGRLPFPGASLGQMLAGGSQAGVPPPSSARAGVPPSLDALVTKLLQRDPARRCQSAAEVARELSALAERLTAPGPRRVSGLRAAYAIPVVVLLVALAAGWWFYRRSEQQHWAREAIFRLPQLFQDRPVSAFLMWRKAAQILPGNPQLAQIAASNTVVTSVDSEPQGMKVEIQDYRNPKSDWLALGTTPIKGSRRPAGYFTWKLSKPGVPDFISAPVAGTSLSLAAAPPGIPPRMVRVPAGLAGGFVDFIGWVSARLPAYDIDKLEVTNSEYQAFIAHGGYRNPDYWKEKFVKDGKELSWQQAMELFRDSTGRPGPSTWEGGHFPVGRANYPVSGISWYEAAAYAAYSGKSLPALTQWYKAAPPDLAVYSINQSNFNAQGPAPVESSGGVGPYGTLGMSGNVREWCLNTIDGDQRFILGGAWRTQTYAAYDPNALPPFDRSELNGIRCVRNEGPLPAGATAPIVRNVRDFSKAKPVSDDVFQAYRTLYSYDRTPVNPQDETLVADTPDWTEKKLSIDGGYEHERLPVYLFLPKNVHAPFQSVVSFPSARVNTMPAGDALGDMQFIDYVIRSGRALIYPIYTGTYGRVAHERRSGAAGALDLLIRNSRELRRSVDYLETRPDIDKSRIAYLGVSQGTAYGVILATLEDRFRTVIFLDGGFFLDTRLPADDQVNFVTRLKKPVLMVGGKYDFSFSAERSQMPMFRMLGTPQDEKRQVFLETPHDVSQAKGPLSKEVLGWLDKYLGRVN